VATFATCSKLENDRAIQWRGSRILLFSRLKKSEITRPQARLTPHYNNVNIITVCCTHARYTFSHKEATNPLHPIPDLSSSDQEATQSNSTGAKGLHRRAPTAGCRYRDRSQSCFGLIHMAHDTRVAGEIENNQNPLARREPLYASCPQAQSPQGLGRHPPNIPRLTIPVRSNLLLPTGFQGIGDSSERKTKGAFIAIHVTSRKAPAVTASIKSEPK
jgi:hypothetical protein